LDIEIGKTEATHGLTNFPEKKTSQDLPTSYIPHNYQTEITRDSQQNADERSTLNYITFLCLLYAV